MKINRIYKLSLYSIDCDEEDLKDFTFDSLQFLFEKRQLDLMGYIIGNSFIELITKTHINIQNNYAIYKDGKLLNMDSKIQESESFTYVKVTNDYITGKKYLNMPTEYELKKYLEKKSDNKFKKSILDYKKIGDKYYHDYKNYQKIKEIKK